MGGRIEHPLLCSEAYVRPAPAKQLEEQAMNELVGAEGSRRGKHPEEPSTRETPAGPTEADPAEGEGTSTDRDGKGLDGHPPEKSLVIKHVYVAYEPHRTCIMPQRPISFPSCHTLTRTRCIVGY